MLSNQRKLQFCVVNSLVLIFLGGCGSSGFFSAIGPAADKSPFASGTYSGKLTIVMNLSGFMTMKNEDTYDHRMYLGANGIPTYNGKEIAVGDKLTDFLGGGSGLDVTITDLQFGVNGIGVEYTVSTSYQGFTLKGTGFQTLVENGEGQFDLAGSLTMGYETIISVKVDFEGTMTKE
jgi:hypothetical protein